MITFFQSAVQSLDCARCRLCPPDASGHSAIIPCAPHTEPFFNGRHTLLGWDSYAVQVGFSMTDYPSMAARSSPGVIYVPQAIHNLSIASGYGRGLVALSYSMEFFGKWFNRRHKVGQTASPMSWLIEDAEMARRILSDGGNIDSLRSIMEMEKSS